MGSPISQVDIVVLKAIMVFINLLSYLLYTATVTPLIVTKSSITTFSSYTLCNETLETFFKHDLKVKTSVFSCRW